jgi:hypothetical protein
MAVYKKHWDKKWLNSIEQKHTPARNTILAHEHVALSLLQP